MTVDWRSLPPQQVLDDFPALTPSQVAHIIPSCWSRNGDPSRRRALELIKSGALQLVDPTLPSHRWSVTSDEVRRYLSAGPRRGGDVVPIRDAS